MAAILSAAVVGIAGLGAMLRVMTETFIQAIPLDAPDDERAAMQAELATFVANLKESGMDPTVDVEPTSGGDVFIVTAGRNEPEAL